MLIQPANDPTLSPEDSEALRRSLITHSAKFPSDRLWTVEGAGHVLALAADAEGYRRELEGFLAGALPESEGNGVDRERLGSLDHG